MISRHAGWMVVVTSSLLTPVLVVLLMAPALTWAAWRKRMNVPVHRLSWTWDLAGAILGALLLLGPLQTIQGLHPAAPASLALGMGVQLRRRLVRPSITVAAHFALAGSDGDRITAGLHPVAMARSRGDPGAGMVAARRPYRQPVVDRRRHAPRRPHEPPWLRSRHHPRARALGPKGDHLRDGSLGRAVDIAVAHRDVYRALAVAARSAGRPAVLRCVAHRGRISPAPGATPPPALSATCESAIEPMVVGRGFDTYIDYPCNQEVSVRAALNNSALGASVMKLADRIGLPVPKPFPVSCRRPAREIAAQGRQWLDNLELQKPERGDGVESAIFPLS